MIISDNIKPAISEFRSLISNMDNLLNQDALAREDYYTKRGGKLLEQDVFAAIEECAKGTPFQGSIQLVSGASFPDIIASKLYGVEVKSTEKDHWTSIGSSILESTRDKDVSKIFLTFGKLGRPVRFLSRPYEECLSGIAVTHYPRYQIDMMLDAGDTIFDKMGVSYDDLRVMDNPVEPVSKYFRSKMKPGETLWWVNNPESVSPPTVRLWTALSTQEKERYAIQGYAYFPEVLGNSSTKYNNYALWLATQQGIVNTNVRDSFSAGGKVQLRLKNGILLRMPAVFGRINKHKKAIIKLLNDANAEDLKAYWGVDELSSDRLSQWIELSAKAADAVEGYQKTYLMLDAIMFSDVNG